MHEYSVRPIEFTIYSNYRDGGKWSEIFLMSTDLIYFTQIVCLQFLEFRDGKFWTGKINPTVKIPANLYQQCLNIPKFSCHIRKDRWHSTEELAGNSFCAMTHFLKAFPFHLKSNANLIYCLHVLWYVMYITLYVLSFK